jgi:hypothetical protein
MFEKEVSEVTQADRFPANDSGHVLVGHDLLRVYPFVSRRARMELCVIMAPPRWGLVDIGGIGTQGSAGPLSGWACPGLT